MEPIARPGSTTLSAPSTPLSQLLPDLGGILTMITYHSPRAARSPPLRCIRSRRRGTSGTAQRAASSLTFVDRLHGTCSAAQ